MALSKYLQQTSDLLHDQNFLFTSQSQMTMWVNEARRQAAQRTGCVRRLLSGQSAFGASAQPGILIPGAGAPGVLPNALPAVFPNGQPPSPATNYTTTVGAASNAMQTIPSVERYPYVGFFNPFLKRAHAGCEAIIDVMDLAVNWGGACRPALAWLPWDALQAYARAYATLVTSYPYYWSVMNDGEQGEIYLFPAPSTFGEFELDCICVPSDLNSDNDFDAIPGGMRNSIKFLAASLAFLTKKQYVQAQLYDNMFADRLGIARVASDRGKIPNYYTTVFD